MERREFPRLGEVCYFHRLENGLPVYIVPKPGYVRRYAALAVFCGGMHRRFSRTGAPPEELPSGAACLLAHMISAGGEGSALRALAAAGVSAGVRTAPDVTVYHISCTQSFSSHLRTLLRTLTTPQFSSDRATEALRSAAAELDGREKDPRAAACDHLLRALYSQRPISESRPDTRASLSSISPQALARCYDALYCPGNMALCITGEVDPHQMIALARMMLPESSAPPARPEWEEEAPGRAAQAGCTVEMDTARPRFCLGFKAPAPTQGSEGLRQLLVGQLATQLLAGESSPLRARLYAEGLTETGVDARYQSCPGAAVLTLAGESPDPERVRALVLEEAQALAGQTEPERFARVRRAAYGRRLLELDRPDVTALRLLRGCFGGYHDYEWVELYPAIGEEEVLAFLRRVVREEGSSLSVVRPRGGTV